MMKRISILFTTLGFCLFFLGGQAVAQDLPKPSPLGSVKQKVGLTHIEVEYSRPGVKERKIFGELVPFGEIWRTGANKATSVSFDTPVFFDGQKVESGTYALFMIPRKDEAWTVIINANPEQWGTGDYDEEKNVLTLKVKAEKSDCFVETMQFTFDKVKNSSAELTLSWENTKLSIPFTVKVKEKAMENIEKAIAEIENAYGTYNSAARYYIDHGIETDQALEWAKKSVEIKEAFWNLYTLSLAYEAKGNYKKAIEVAEKSKKMAEEANYDAYIKRNENNIKKWKDKIGE